MKPEDYYKDIHGRSSAWAANATEPGFAPMEVAIDAARVHLQTGGRVLDIGCQGGHQLALFSGEFDELVGLDIAPYVDMWDLLPHARFVVHDVDAAPLPFTDGFFQTVICTNVLEHVFDVFGLVREIERVLADGGTCLISVPNVSAWRHILTLVRGRVPRTGAQEYPFDSSQGWDGQHLHYFTHSELRWLLEFAGLTPIATNVHGRLQPLKRIAPRLLSGSVDLVAQKSLVHQGVRDDRLK
jgi:SAM-dependent methyltransferase